MTTQIIDLIIDVLETNGWARGDYEVYRDDCFVGYCVEGAFNEAMARIKTAPALAHFRTDDNAVKSNVIEDCYDAWEKISCEIKARGVKSDDGQRHVVIWNDEVAKDIGEVVAMLNAAKQQNDITPYNGNGK